jgi:beta-phosphoglucomutase
MQQSKIRAVIFDMDGVLTDSEPLINAAAIEMFKEKGLTVQPEDFLPFVGTGEDRYIGGVAEKHHFPIDLPSAKSRTYEIYLKLVPNRLQAFPCAHELVQACRQAGLRLAVASSADRVKIEANLRQIGLPPETWDALVCGEEVTNKKPAPEIFLAAASKLGLTPGECVVVEDAVNGVEAAKAAGMRCVAVAQTFPADRLHRADIVRPTLFETSVADLLNEPKPGTTTELPPVSEPLNVNAPSDAMAGTRTLRPWGFWATVGLTLAILLAGMIGQVAAFLAYAVIAKILNHGTFPKVVDYGLIMALATCLSCPVVVGLVYLFSRIRNGQHATFYLGFRSFTGIALLRWSIAFLVLIALSDSLTVLLGRPIVPPVIQEAYQSAGFLPLFWFALIVAAPLAEESLFRGFLFEGILHSRLGATGAIIGSAVWWALIHVQYDWYGIATVFAAGLLLGWARFKTGSLYPTLFLHSLMNLIATIETALLAKGQS